MAKHDSTWITATEASVISGKHRSTLYRWAMSGRIGSTHDNKKMYYLRSEMEIICETAKPIFEPIGE